MVRGPLGRVGEEVTELFAHPGGWAARPMAHVLNFFNRRGNQLVAGALEVRPGHRVLEIGFGGGAAVPATLGALGGDGQLCAVDLSPDMAILAARRFRTAVENGTLLLASANVAALPLESAVFDRAYALHSHMYWPSPLAGIREIHRVLRPEGRMLLAMDVVSGIRLIQWFGRGYQPAGPDRLVELFGDAGFTHVTTARLTSGVVAVLGTRH
jgi:SAM-dependent methyltransferase